MRVEARVVIPDDVLARPVEEAARLFALAFLDEACAAAPRLADATDTEALHDFRVALRRLRSALRAYQPWLRGGVKKSLARELRALAAATGGGRDAEVLLAWVEAQSEHIAPRERTGVAWLTGALERRRDEGYAAVRGDVAPRFAAFEAQLRAGLEVYSVSMRLGERRSVRTLAAALAGLVREHAADLGEKLAQVASLADEEPAHDARISSKRLRYLLDPLRDKLPGARELLRELKELQDALGELHDLQVLAREIGDAAAHAAAERARRLHDLALEGDPDGTRTRRTLRDDERHGLLALATRVRARIAELFHAAEQRWLGPRSGGLVAAAGDVARALDAHASAGQEIERKYLLTGLPPEAAAAPAKVIEQGYLPGQKLIERVRRVVGPDGAVKCFRTVKAGAGLVRVEIEEETPLELFRKLWPLTRGKRVKKRRHMVVEGAHTWEIDVFLDRTLFLAEIELASAEEVVEVPAWLAPYVVREVTTESGLVNARLAK
jgi:CHAD domain-containing protein/CYTH domain-containing protein